MAEKKATADREQARVDELAKAVSDHIVEPFALVAGLLANAKDKVPLEEVGRLVGLMVRGARTELNYWRKGGPAVAYLESMFGPDAPSSWETKAGAAVARAAGEMVPTSRVYGEESEAGTEVANA